ncbi:MAG TPA: S8 family serine peptidase [Rhodanobacteraceae bacterium]|nr:S8 family serine peptidase [Rhodanobacteraceae bacterium]
MSTATTFASSAVSDSPRASGLVAVSAGTTARYIVRFDEAPLATYNSSPSGKQVNGISHIPSKTFKNGRTRLDVGSSQAKAYVGFLKQQQNQHLSDIAKAIGHTPTKTYAMQHALNAVVLQLSPAEAQKIATVPGVLAVERDRPHALATDIGPGFIGASSLWWGTVAGQDSLFASGFDGVGYRGDGVVIGDIDTGYNSASPSFSATDSAGYTITNPLGAGTFLPDSQCNLPTISIAGCNDKVIGVYDEINLTGGGPPFSVEDTQGHGSHTASTAGGNARSGTILGYTAPLSGVAPHANLVIYYACSPDPNVQCSTSATTASVDQAIQDGVVDALNYSISGGESPWADSTSLAFLAAEDAGIFIAAAGGNTSASVPNQVPGTVNHVEPWVTTVAAANHTGGALDQYLSITGPGSPSPGVQHDTLTSASGDTPATGTITKNVVLSPQFHNSDLTGSDGCGGPAPDGDSKLKRYPHNVFAGSIALISRGTCSFYVKIENAVAAGAIAVVIADNRPEGAFTPLATDPNTNTSQPVPVYSVNQADGASLQTWLAAHANTSPGVIPFPSKRLTAQADELAGFSLLGPATIDVVKPDLQGPGVAILAAFSNDGTANGPNVVGFDSGTSMATPHTTGSGALLLGLHPDWTPAEAKSALMMTGKEDGLTKADGTTASDYFDRGSGRLQDFQASHAGLVLGETLANFTAANPAASGDPTTLNLASMQSSSCVNACSFTRTFRSTQDHSVTWTASVNAGPNPGFTSVTVTPTSFPVTAGGSSGPVQFDVDSSAFASDGSSHFAEVVLTPDDAALPPLHLTVAIAMPVPTIAAAPNPLSIFGVGATSANSILTVSNIGGPTLNVDQTATGSVPFIWSNQISGDSFGYTTTQYTGKLAGDTDFYAADDFTVSGNSPVDLTKIFTPGFTANHTLASFGATLPVHWRIYSDAAGVPSSNPVTAGPAVWSFDSTAAGAGVVVTGPFGGDISLDLVAANQHTALAAGHYWLVVYPTLPCTDGGSGCTEGWLWLTSNNGSGSSAVDIAPPTAQPAWTAIDPGTGAGFAMHLESAAACTPPSWLSATGLPAALGGGANTPVTVTATAPLGAASVTGYLCLGSNDASTPVLPVQVNAAQ